MDIATHLDRLIATLDLDGQDAISQAISAAVRAVPRHLFIPDVGLIEPRAGSRRLIDRQADPDAWFEVVYGNHYVVTQLDDGRTPLTALEGDYTSSASQPGTVATLLKHLAAEPGCRVLEIGTGTGYTAALLSHMVGQDNVVSIEVDAGIAEQAAKKLAAAGLRPWLVVGDGAAGHPGHGPYDRVHVTCGIRDIPPAWVAQCRPGALIVLPWHPGFGAGHCLRLVVQADGTARGRVVDGAAYMMMRSQRLRPDENPERDDERRRYWTALDPRALDHLSAGADLAISALTGLHAHSETGVDDDGEWLCMWVSDPVDAGRWATVTWRPGRSRHVVQQAGDRPVWDEVLQAYARWVAWGEPHWSDFGVTVAEDGTHVWLSSPENVL
ncbi:methyltransferase domain-containing protein [Nonomuraea sp. PA05]|uniref:methyltransferase domain-containing protein n=1 Tax=Nonomuraea sp. PA05 TaxID=2604466 RepID=UPI0011DC41F3|nr:methyltransferase domain-containing protein [Nonomuraea sp. PA05]TYB67753.1 methyltransferase domain-containing protein [Nonomuraea sp. PA05]